MKYIASCSFGKDSLAMVLMLIERDLPLDEVVFYDTGMEFQAIYDLRDAMLPIFQRHGIKYTTLYPDNPFLYDMLERPVKGRERRGYGWCGGLCRWGTTCKLRTIDQYAERQSAKVYVGIAADEMPRLQKERKPYKLFPLAEFGMTEADCLQYCYSAGYDAKDDRMSGDPNQMNIQSMYSDIDLDANGIEMEFQASMEELLWFVNKHLANTGGRSFEGEDVTVIFDRDVLINETEAINNCKNSVGILSDETIVKMHPWVTDPEQELQRIKDEKEEAAQADPYQAAFLANRNQPPVNNEGGGDGKTD